jgi:hypothetical protein
MESCIDSSTSEEDSESAADRVFLKKEQILMIDILVLLQKFRITLPYALFI